MTDVPPKVSLREQAEEAARELTSRYRIYAGRVKRGDMTEAESAVGIARMRAIRNTLRLFAEHEDAMRDALAQAIERKRRDAEIDAVRDHPMVAGALKEFPDAEITGVTTPEETAPCAG